MAYMERVTTLAVAGEAIAQEIFTVQVTISATDIDAIVPGTCMVQAIISVVVGALIVLETCMALETILVEGIAMTALGIFMVPAITLAAAGGKTAPVIGAEPVVTLAKVGVNANASSKTTTSSRTPLSETSFLVREETDASQQNCAPCHFWAAKVADRPGRDRANKDHGTRSEKLLLPPSHVPETLLRRGIAGATPHRVCCKEKCH